MIVAQLVEQSLPIPDVLGKNLWIEKTKIKKKRPGMALFNNSTPVMKDLIKGRMK